MMEDKNKRNNWTKNKIEEAKKKINKEIYKSKLSLLSSIISSIGILKNYNCRKLIFEYVGKVMDKINNIIYFDKELIKFSFT